MKKTIMRKTQKIYLAPFACFLLVSATAVYATTLEVSADAPVWASLGAAVLLYSHIGGGMVGLLAGTVAVIAPKGNTLHRRAGKVFFISMFVTYFIGGGVAPFLAEGQRPNFVAAVLALYLLISGVLAAKRRNFQAGIAETMGLVVALTITAMGLLFIYIGVSSESGTVDGSPPQAFFLFTIVGTFAAIGELRVIIKRSLSNTARVMRHLWRMCLSFFIASGSLFLGQPQLFPLWFKETPLPFVFAFAPVVIALIWLVKMKLSQKARDNAVPVTAA
jgi:uncharacterized membrane protein